MRIERCLVMDCRVYTKFVGRADVIIDEFDTPERARIEQKDLIRLAAIFNEVA